MDADDNSSPAQPPEKRSFKDNLKLTIMVVALAMIITLFGLEAYRSVSTGTPFSSETFDKALSGLLTLLDK